MRRALILLCALVATGCSSRQAVESLELQPLGPLNVEAGQTLEVQGSGFTTGAGCEVVLEGQSRRPGASARKVRVPFTGRALSSELVRFVLDEAGLAALGGHGAFEGTAHVAMNGRDTLRRFEGQAPVTLDLSGPLTLAERAALERDARALAERAGVMVSNASAPRGVSLLRIREGSAAAASGLLPGDLVVRAAGVPVRSLADLAPAPHVPAIELRVMRADEARDVVIGDLTPQASMLSPRVQRLTWLAAFGLAAIALWGPLPLRRVRGALASRPAPLAHATTMTAEPNRIPLRRWPLGLGLVVGLSVFALLGSRVRAEVGGLYAALTGLTLAIALIDGTSVGVRRRLWVAAQVLAAAALGGTVLGAACALGGTQDTAALVEAQGPLPWQWSLFRHPALLAGGFALIAVAGPIAPTRSGHFEMGLRVLDGSVRGGLGAALLLGGWQWPPELALGAIPPAALGSVAFVVKGCALLAFSSWAAREGVRWRAAAVAAVACAALATTEITLVPAGVLQHALGHALFGAACLVTLATLLRTLPRRAHAQ
jgi:hypothetical protein